jgi:hypothetical protein
MARFVGSHSDYSLPGQLIAFGWTPDLGVVQT